MRVKGITVEALDRALAEVNKLYNDNIVYNRDPERHGNYIHFTIKVKDSSKDGARRGFCTNKNGEPRKLINACWHVHGHLFEEIFKQYNNAVIYAGTQEITIFNGNWIDRNIGSMMQPLYFSNACECKK